MHIIESLFKLGLKIKFQGGEKKDKMNAIFYIIYSNL